MGGDEGEVVLCAASAYRNPPLVDGIRPPEVGHGTVVDPRDLERLDVTIRDAVWCRERSAAIQREGDGRRKIGHASGARNGEGRVGASREPG